MAGDRGEAQRPQEERGVEVNGHLMRTVEELEGFRTVDTVILDRVFLPYEKGLQGQVGRIDAIAASTKADARIGVRVKDRRGLVWCDPDQLRPVNDL